MTGFGSAGAGSFKVEIRSVNHRFLDISVKIPQNLSQHEMPLRTMVRERFSRGRFDILVTVVNEGNLRVKINRDLVRELYEALRVIKDELSLSDSIGIQTLAGFRELILTEEVEYSAESLYAAAGGAIENLLAMRRREGEAVAADIRARLEVLEGLNREVISLCPEVVSEKRKKLLERFSGLFAEMRFDENRVLQEAALLAEKADITEETTRIGSHIAQMKKILSDGDTIGRKAEFLLQELNREANTIASKADDFRISALAVEMKAELEKMREQAQNIQ
ncbi:MAG: YicC family protein [Nitrospirae bacterium]|nr:YicC family protein [Nitrospirota bacterium]